MFEEDIDESQYDNGHWVWDDTKDKLEFIKHFKLQQTALKTLRKPLVFNDDPDVYDQLRFAKCFQRPFNGDDDVVTLQDVKDVTLFTAPSVLLTIDIINVLHMPAPERFLRSLIFYCQYFLQVTKELNERSSDTRIRTPKSEEIEMEFHANLEDLRILVAKEYSAYLLLTLDTENIARHNHMGPRKKPLVTKKDAILKETFLLMSIQIVWIALGRKSKEAIEIEVNRLFKSDKFNVAEHRYKYQATIKSKTQSLVLGNCLRRDTMLKTCSPLMNEVFCHRNLDSRMFGLGVVKYPNLDSRLEYFESVLILPEENLRLANVTLGILGASRKLFDPMLKDTKEQRLSRVDLIKLSPKLASIKSNVSSSTRESIKLYATIVLPERQTEPTIEETFPSKLHTPKPIDTIQKHKWISRVKRRQLTLGRNTLT